MVDVGGMLLWCRESVAETVGLCCGKPKVFVRVKYLEVCIQPRGLRLFNRYITVTGVTRSRITRSIT